MGNNGDQRVYVLGDVIRWVNARDLIRNWEQVVSGGRTDKEGNQELKQVQKEKRKTRKKNRSCSAGQMEVKKGNV